MSYIKYNQFQNKKYNGARCVIFYSHNSQNQIQMQIIEILRKNEQNKTSNTPNKVTVTTVLHSEEEKQAIFHFNRDRRFTITE